MADSECSHPVQMHGLCAVCGKDLIDGFQSEFPEEVPSTPTLHILHTTPHIKVTPQEAKRIESENMNRLLGERKLSLVVDLDQTVLHATVDPAANDWLQDVNHPNHEYIKDIQRVALHDSPHVYFIKLRPGLVKFFSTISKLYELHIYTMGSRSYAHAVVKLFDPDGKLFHDRILSRDDSEIIENHKMLTRIFPTDDRMVVVIDDRSDVWPNCPNLLQVPAYTFFVGTGDIHNPAGVKANQLPSDVLDSQAGIQQHTTATVINVDDNELANIQTVLEQIHSKFFSQYEQKPDHLPDVKLILPQMKRSIFEGCHFVFSGLLNHHSIAEEQYIWKLCTEFGAVCENEIGPQTTHLISIRDDTEKVLEAAESGIPVIKPDWVYESIRSWKQLDQEGYSVISKGMSKPNRRFSQKRRLEEAFDDEADLDDGKEIIASPVVFDASELEEINKELEELEGEEEEEEEEEDYDDVEEDERYLAAEIENGLISEDLSSTSGGEFDEYQGTGSEGQGTDGSLDELEESLF